jgi:mono/diheme cytochrome c family protein/glucose/arabinose dehydrogenase
MGLLKTPIRKTGATLATLLSSLAGFGWLYAFQAAPPAWPPPVQPIPAAAPALPVDEALKTFFLPPGYNLEVVASEPLVHDPIVMDQGPDGRLYVIEMPAFAIDETMQDSHQPICRVVVLEDTDNDGRMDKRTVFLDKLVLPRAVKVLADGVLIGEPPHLWLAKDTDGDLKADTKELIRDDFGRADGNVEHNANGLYWGMDNTIYTSEHTWNLRLKNGKFEVEPALSRGQWNISQDDAGRIYRNWNEQPLYVDIIPGRYFLRNPNIVRTRGLYELLIERDETAIWPVRPTPGLQRAYRKGFLRPDGTATTYASSADPYVFRGDRLPKEMQGDAFVADSPTNLVHRLTIEDDGTGRLKARDAYAKGEFLASTDERFRPVNLFSAADGTLYIIDMYRGVVQDVAYQTEYLNAYIKENKLQLPIGLGRIYRVVHESMKPGPKPSLSSATPAELVKTLSHPNGWWRDMAQQLLVQHGETSVAPQLKQLALTAPDWRTKLHALWTLDGIDAIDTATIEKALDDPSPDVRAAAIRISERWLRQGDRAVEAAVLRQMSDTNWIVRRQLAASLGELPPVERLAPLTQILERYAEDPILVDAAVSSLAGQEMIVMDRLMAGNSSEQRAGDAITLLAAAIANGKNEPVAQRIFDLAANANRPTWQRLALLRGVEVGLGGGDRGGGGFGGLGGVGGSGGFGRSNGFPLTSEPQPLASLAKGSDELAELAGRILPRLSWPGKPAPAAQGPALSADEKARVAAGAELYANFCAGCHMQNGEGNPQGGAKSLVSSNLVTGNPAAVLRVVLSGKEGSNGLMPPLRSALNDEQIAAVVSYIRRAWGHTASAVTIAEVQETRGITSLRKTPWSDEELTPFTGGRYRGAPPPQP